MKRSYALIVPVLLLVACGDSGSSDSASGGSDAGGGPAGGAAGFGEADVVEAVATFRDAGFARITDMPTTTQHGLAPRAVVWVSNEAADAYRAIDPADLEATAPPFPVGTIVIKESRTEAGEPDGSSTVMAKLDAGFNSDAGDWWWGRFDTDGALADSGVLGFCIDCHQGNDFADTDYVGGVALDNRFAEP
jgi:hypothetical protein